MAPSVPFLLDLNSVLSSRGTAFEADEKDEQEREVKLHLDGRIGFMKEGRWLGERST